MRRKRAGLFLHAALCFLKQDGWPPRIQGRLQVSKAGASNKKSN
jgi:hypothetical protein